MSGEHHLNVLCATLGASRSGYYAWRQWRASARARNNDQRSTRMARLHARSRGTYGSLRVVRDPREEGQHIGHNRVARLMRTAGLWGRQRRRYRGVTTDSDHPEPIAPKRLADQPGPTRPDQVWVSDLTYVPTAEELSKRGQIADIDVERPRVELLAGGYRRQGSRLPLEIESGRRTDQQALNSRMAVATYSICSSVSSG